MVSRAPKKPARVRIAEEKAEEAIEELEEAVEDGDQQEIEACDQTARDAVEDLKKEYTLWQGQIQNDLKSATTKAENSETIAAEVKSQLSEAQAIISQLQTQITSLEQKISATPPQSSPIVETETPELQAPKPPLPPAPPAESVEEGHPVPETKAPLRRFRIL